MLNLLFQRDDFDSTFPEKATLDEAARMKLISEWKQVVFPAKEWNERTEGEVETEATERRALQLTERHIEVHPDDPRALYLGATILVRMRDNTRGLEWARRALAIDPEETSIPSAFV
jgi:hypothetical protein